jgi:hypothetical protein
VSAPDPWDGARDRATWENQAWAAGAAAERERIRQAAVFLGAAFETYAEGVRPFADLLHEPAPEAG